MYLPQRQQAPISPAQWVDVSSIEESELAAKAVFLFENKKSIMLKKSKKEEMMKELEGAVKDAPSLVFVNFHGMKVSDETILRRDLRDKGVAYKVYRKTLLKRVLNGKAEGEMPELGGEVAVAYSKDPTASAREIYNFQKDHKGIINILGGIFDGKFLDGVRMMEIATIPSKEVLLSKIAFLFKSPMQRLAIAVNEVAKKK
jgi:large subunit ribosomal protein L10